MDKTTIVQIKRNTKMPKQINDGIPTVIENGAYWRISTPDEGVEDLTVPLILNCAGFAYMESPFDISRTRVDYYLQFMDRGILQLKTGDEYTEFSRGQFIIHKKGSHYAYRLKKGSDPMGYYWAHFTGFDVENLLAKVGLECDKVYTCDGDLSDYFNLFNAIFREIFKREKNFEIDTASQFARLIVKLGRAINPEWKERVKTLRFKNSLSYIHTEYMKNIDVKTLADMEELSVSRYRTLFREMTGMAPTEYIINLKIEHACELLFCTSYSVTTIANMCGYSDVLYFIRLFKKKIGVTPGKYKLSKLKDHK